MFLKLIVMIVLGLVSAALSLYNRNYFVSVVDDIVGREEEESAVARIGRSFVYGFLFPVYFVLLVTGAVALIVCLVVGGIVAGIVYGLIWVTEKIIPNESLGRLIQGLFALIKLPGFKPTPGPEQQPAGASTTLPESAWTAPSTPAGPAGPTNEDTESPFPGGGINRNRVHKLD